MSSTTTSATSAHIPLTATATTVTTPFATTTKIGPMRGGDVSKGKYTNRSWQQLPPDIIRLIATHYLSDVSLNTYVPQTWLVKEMWNSRIVYTVLRDANDLERVMRVTPTWRAALETHHYWYHACSIVDPHDTFAHHIHANPAVPLQHSSRAPRPISTPYRHFRTLTTTSCIVCLINVPPSAYISAGLFLAKRTHLTPTLGVITLCKDHRRAFFCGLCLREAPAAECEPDSGYRGAGGLGGFGMSGYAGWEHFGGTMGVNAFAGISPYVPLQPSLMVCCAENEDEESWPGVETTCRSCRTEWLWRRIAGNDRDKEAIGGARYVSLKPTGASGSCTVPQPSNKSASYPPSALPYWPLSFHSADYQTRRAVEAFVEVGEGVISEVVSVAREKLWLRKETKMVELMGQALAAAKWEGSGGVGGMVECGSAGDADEISGWGTTDNVKGKIKSNPTSTPHRDHPLSPSSVQSTGLHDDDRYYVSQDDYEGEQDARSDVAEVDGHSPHSYDYGYDGSHISQDQDCSLLKGSPDDVDLYAGALSPVNDEDAQSTFSERSDTSDPDLFALSEDSGVRELAISDWARGRVLDGWWCSPADEWYGLVRRVDDENAPDSGWRSVRAVHPCPWRISPSDPYQSQHHQQVRSPPSHFTSNLSSSESASNPTSEQTYPHPLPQTVQAPIPPSFALCEQAYRAYQKQLRLVLAPAMKNIVKRIVAEASACETGGADPVTRAAHMSMEEVLAELRLPGVWFDGVEWIAIKDESSNNVMTDSNTLQEGQRMGKKADEDESSSSGTERSDGSHATSPVLSTTTLRTTPSPPPVREKGEGFAVKPTIVSRTKFTMGATMSSNARMSIFPIPISPLAESPTLLHPIPYVPLTTKGMPQYSMDALKAVWRDVCAPLYYCHCSICQRGLMNAQAASSVQPQATNNYAQVQVQSQNQLVYATHPPQRPIEVVRLEEHPAPKFYEEEEEEEDDDDDDDDEFYAEEEEESEGEDLELSSDEAELDIKTRQSLGDLRVVRDPGTIGKIYLSLPAHARTQTQHSITPKKRSSGDLCVDQGGRDADDKREHQKGGTPPKRPRRESDDKKLALNIVAPTPAKRGDANVRHTSNTIISIDNATPMRQRKRSSEEIDTSGDSTNITNGYDIEQLDNAKRPRVERLKVDLVKGGELDGLYVFEGESGGVNMT